MTDLAPPGLVHFEPSIRDRRIAWTAGVSVLAHLGLLALLLWPVLQHPAPPPEPKPIAVDVVTPKQYAALVKPPPPKPVSKPDDKAAEAPKPKLVPVPRRVVVPLPSMADSSEPVSSGAPSSDEASSELASSMALASAAPSSAEASSAAPSSAPAAPSEAVSSAEVSSTASASEPASRVSAEPSASASEAAPSQVLTASGVPDASADAVASEAPAAASAQSAAPAAAVKPAPDLRPARHLLSGALLKTPEMAQMRAQLKARGTHLSLVQLCNIEAIAQVRQDSPLAAIDLFVANATSPTSAGGQRLSAPGAAFRIGGDWFGIAYDCTAAKTFESVTAFSFKLGGAIPPSALGARLSGLAGNG